MPAADDRPTSMHATPPPHSAAAAMPAFGEHAGDTLGPYRLLEILGEGGFGIVWLAERTVPFVQRVAIKIIKPGMDTREVIARFEQERQALAVMDHPNVARVHDAGATSRGRPYFVMELVAGEPITDYCDKQRLTLRQRLELFIPVCEAVQHAHQKGIIHRDLKPSNILVSVRDGQPTPKVIDFGVAKAISHALTDKTIFTESGRMIGTPEYMSPEQAEMRSGDIDTRSDVYSLGAVLYELLTGTAPFESGTLRDFGVDGLVRTIREVDPPKPSTRLTSLNAAESVAIAEHRRAEKGTLAALLRNELEWIPLKALRKDRTERYGSPADLARDIRNYLEGRALEAGPETTAYRLRKLARRHRGAFVAGGAIAATLIGGVVAFGWQARRAWIERDAAIAARKTAEEERAKSQAINEFIQNALKASDPNQGGRQDMLVAEAMASAVGRLGDGAFRDQPEVEIALRYTIAEILDGNAHSAEGLAMGERGLEIARRLHPPPPEGHDHADVARGLGVVGTCLHSLGRDVEALPKFNDALAMQKRLHTSPEDHPDVAQAMGNVAECLSGGLHRPAEALPLYEQSLAMFRRVFAGDDPHVATGMNNLAFCLQSLGRGEEALPLYEKALEMQRRLYPGDHPDVARGLNNVGYCLEALGRPADALPKYQGALEMRKRMFKGDHPSIARAMRNVAVCLGALRKHADALPMHEDSVAMLQRVYGADHPDIAAGLTEEATCLHLLGRAPDALDAFEKALAMLRRLGGADREELANALNNVGRERFLLKRAADAEAPLREAVGMYVRVNPADRSNLANGMANLAACLEALGKHEEAMTVAEGAAAMAARVLPEGSPIRKKCEGVLESIRKVAGVGGEAKPEG